MKEHTQNEGAILIITLTGDVHVPFVTKHLTSKVILVDPFRMLDGCELSYVHDGEKTLPVYDGQRLDNIKSVWYRRPYIPEREDFKKVPDGYKDYSYTSVRKHSHDLYGLFQDAFWLSDYYTILKAETKPRQLELAASLGFRTPRTITTSDSEAAASFLARTGDCVAKSMATSLPVVDGRAQYFYTTKIVAGQQVNLSGLNVAPSIFQEAIDTALDLRVTVVDDQVFAASVCDKGQDDHPAIRDWRRAYTAGTLCAKAYDLPVSIQKQCIALTRKLNLSFGAIDLLVDTKGDYWFLEINPNGQWAFVEEDTGLPIGKAIAQLLENGVQEQ